MRPGRFASKFEFSISNCRQYMIALIVYLSERTSQYFFFCTALHTSNNTFLVVQFSIRSQCRWIRRATYSATTFCIMVHSKILILCFNSCKEFVIFYQECKETHVAIGSSHWLAVRLCGDERSNFLLKHNFIGRHSTIVWCTLKTSGNSCTVGFRLFLMIWSLLSSPMCDGRPLSALS